MEFPNLFMVWVVRNNAIHLVSTEKTLEDAKNAGNRLVSNKDFLIKEYHSLGDPTPSAPVVTPVEKPHPASLFSSPSNLKTVNQPSIAEDAGPVDLFKNFKD